MTRERGRPVFQLDRSPGLVAPDVRDQRLARPGFGSCFSDHMVTIRWTRGRGWYDARVRPYGPLELDPAAMGLHYAQSVFEGLKAYRQLDGSIALFRPGENARRMNQSAARLAMPMIPEELFVGSLHQLIAVDRDWVPAGPGQSLYLRPVMLATEAHLGVRAADEYLFFVLALPVDPFFSTEVRAVTVWISEDFVRAAPGGTGAVKCAGNYATGLLAQQQAVEHGCDQVVWLDAVERRWVEEMGAMNLFFVWDDGGASPRVTTPEADGTLLPGVVRSSLLTLARDLGYVAQECPTSIEEWRKGCADGRLLEVFASGTAAVVAPVGGVRSARGDWTMGDGSPGPVTLRLRQALLDLQRGLVADRYGWMETVA